MKIKITNYVFDASEKTITFSDYVGIGKDNVLLIVNATDNIIIYNFASATLGGTVATNVLTLTYDTTSMSDSDELLIYYDDDSLQAKETGGNLDSIKTATETTAGNYAIRIDTTTTADVIYIGLAAIGSSTASAVWRIKKIDKSSGIAITWADGNFNFDNIWDNIASLSYS